MAGTEGLVTAYASGGVTVPTSQITFDSRGMGEIAKELGLSEARLRAIAQQTVNRAAVRTRTRIARAVRDEVRQSYAYALDKVNVRKAFLNQGLNEAKVFAERRGLLLSRYEPRQVTKNKKKAGVSVQVGRDKVRKTMKGAFFIKLNNGVEAIAIRKKGEKRAYNVLHGPSASQIFESYRPAIQAEINEFTVAELNRRIRGELGQPKLLVTTEGTALVQDE